MLKVLVASTNPVKIEAAKVGFTKIFPDLKFEFVGVKAESNVRDQPLSDKETLLGATNRITNLKKSGLDYDYLVAQEGGLEDINGIFEAFGWIIIEHKNGKIGRSRTASFDLPTEISELIKQGKELGEADDIIFGKSNSKQGTGSVGILTKDVVTRTSYYSEAVCLALIPFINPELSF